MTTKELRKMSRLELLELLLDAGKENKKLKEQMQKLTAENEALQQLDSLSVLTRQLENSLQSANRLQASLQANTGQAQTAAPKNSGNAQAKPVLRDVPLPADREIYRQMLRFFAKQDEKINVFPDELANIVRLRLKNLLEKSN